MKFFAIVGVVLTIVIAFGVFYLYSGAYNVAATLPHTPFFGWSLKRIQMSSIQSHAESVSPAPDLESVNLEEGLEHFNEMCVTCHGAPGVQPSEIGKGLNPAPPELSGVVEVFSEAELFWTVKHGIKMTGMPAFGPTHGDEEIWAVVGFLERLPRLSGEEYDEMLEEAGLKGDGSHGQSARALPGHH